MTARLAQQVVVPPVSEPTPRKEVCYDEQIAVLGLGYVGLPVAVALAQKYGGVTGFDIDRNRIETLGAGQDWTHEIASTDLVRSTLNFTCDGNTLTNKSMYIVAVPTPVDSDNRPDFEPLLSTCRRLARYLTKGAIVVFESTVYPGATEELCGPELERFSNLKVGKDFHLAYSPERISPGDPLRKLQDIAKLVSADTPQALDRVAAVYEKIITAGVHRTRSIKVAEAAKVFENTQRDVNIALMNEFSLICDKLDIRTRDVVEATQTKWNALPFTPGLVGGHCIGVDPHYLAAKAEAMGLYPELIRASRRRNDGMAGVVADKALRHLARTGRAVDGLRVGILGLTFKEDVPDLRNSKIFDLISALRCYDVHPIVHDAHADPEVARSEGVVLAQLEAMSDLDLMILAVPHGSYLEDIQSAVLDRLAPDAMIIDLKSVLNPDKLPEGLSYWSL